MLAKISKNQQSQVFDKFAAISMSVRDALIIFTGAQTCYLLIISGLYL